MPGQHPDELAQASALTRLQGVVAELGSDRDRYGILIRQLQGGTNGNGGGGGVGAPGDTWQSTAQGPLAGSLAGAWQIAALPTTFVATGDSAAYARLADGSLRIRDAGIYVIATSIAHGGTAGARRQARLIRGMDFGSVNPADLLALEERASPSGTSPVAVLAFVGYLPAGQIVSCWVYAGETVPNRAMMNFEISRTGVGPQGPQGVQGPVGAQGPQGPIGPTGDVIEWLYGSGPPDNAGGQDGDFYLENNGRIWKKQAGVWVYTGINVSGPTGPPSAVAQPNEPIPRNQIYLWVDTDDVPPPATAIPFVTSLPPTSTDGTEVYFQNAAMANDGIAWHLRYRAASISPYKWEFIGGGWLRSYVQATESRTAGTGLGDLATIGPQVVIPLAGDYDLDHGFRFGYHSTLAGVSVYMALDGCGATATARANESAVVANDVAGIGIAPGRMRSVSTLTPGTLVAKYIANGASGAGFFGGRYLHAQPVRVG